MNVWGDERRGDECRTIKKYTLYIPLWRPKKMYTLPERKHSFLKEVFPYRVLSLFLPFIQSYNFITLVVSLCYHRGMSFSCLGWSGVGSPQWCGGMVACLCEYLPTNRCSLVNKEDKRTSCDILVLKRHLEARVPASEPLPLSPVWEPSP